MHLSFQSASTRLVANAGGTKRSSQPADFAYHAVTIASMLLLMATLWAC
jgi:hypothetical protein